jgi:type I restriction enzyme S subunit
MPREGHVSAFYAYYFKSNRMLHDFRIYSQGLTSDTWNLKYPSFAKIKAFYPKNTEQRKIADTMLNLDCVISLRERQLTLLKHSKQALLEQMFVNN